jgi:pilus assembly protein CpaB
MTSIAASMNAERTNRWLLIGALVLAVAAGIAIFVALANTIGDDDGTATLGEGGGEATVLVASETIPPNRKITADMFERVTVSEAALVPGALTEDSALIGQVTRAEVLKGEQISTARLAAAGGDEAFANTIPVGRRASAVTVEEWTSVAGLLVPGDRVDVIATFVETRDNLDGRTDVEVTRVETVLQNIEVLAFAQESLDVVSTVDANGNRLDASSSSGVLGQRPEELDPKPNARTVTLSLTPLETQVLVAAQAKGDITLALRAPGEEEVVPLEETNLDDQGFLPPMERE